MGWLVRAIALARNLGLHSHYRYASSSNQQKRLCKHLWWTCFTRDRVIALCLHRSPMIQTEGFTVSLPELCDFEMGSEPSSLNRLLNGCPPVGNALTMKTIAELYISLTTLCLCMTDILTGHHDISDTSACCNSQCELNTPQPPHFVR